MANDVNVGLIGVGHWGPNYLRILSQLPNGRVLACAEKRPAQLNFVRDQYPSITLYTDYRELLADRRVHAVVIATPSSLHHAMTAAALAAGKHVLVEKPMALTTRDAQDLERRARRARRVLMIGHTFLFNGGVRALKNYFKEGTLGQIRYLHAERTNLGPIREDVNALMDLAPHDISIFLYLLSAMPTAVSANGMAYLKRGREDVAFIQLFFPHRVIANIHVSWLEPCKVRRITLIGSKKMAVFDDITLGETIRIYDKGVTQSKPYSNFGEFQLVLRDGDILTPKIKLNEPLREECQHFLSVVRGQTACLSGPSLGVQVVKIMEAAQKSLRHSGRLIPVS